MSAHVSSRYSGLASLLQDLVPRASGYDNQACAVVYHHNQQELERLEGHANATRYALENGLAVIGKLLVREEAARELETHDITALGDLLATIGESLCELEEMESASRSALANIASRKHQPHAATRLKP